MNYDAGMDGSQSVVDIFETQDLSLIWQSEEYSIWKPMEKQNYYTVTHHVSQGKAQPGFGFIMKTSDQDAVAMPESYTLIKKTEKGEDFTGAEAYAYIFSVNCPSGFVSLGTAVTLGDVPRPGAFYCISSEFAMPLQADNVEESVSPHLARIEPLERNSEACPYCPLQQGIAALLPAAGWDEVGKHAISLPYILLANEINYHTEKPIDKIVIVDISYDLNNAGFEKKPPEDLNVLTVINHSHIPQNIAKTIEYTTSTSESWALGTAVAIGTTMEILAVEKETPQVKFGLKATANIKAEGSFSYGKEVVTEKTDSIEIGMEISWTSKMSVTLVADKFKTNIPFVATLKKYYFDGTTSTGKTEGIYNGVHINNVNVQYGENRQLGEDDSGAAESIGGYVEAEKEICHDPAMLRTKKLFSYPRDKEIRKVTISHSTNGQKVLDSISNKLFDLGKRLNLCSHQPKPSLTLF